MVSATRLPFNPAASPSNIPPAIPPPPELEVVLQLIEYPVKLVQRVLEPELGESYESAAERPASFACGSQIAKACLPDIEGLLMIAIRM
ncbi:hypothetical protein OAS11_01015 [Paracoccaceae bacterium]|nr:hypothetical protein [Paracoccaceae bacterium]